MHTFTDLVDRCTAFTLAALGEVNKRTIGALQTNGVTSLVKTLQMVQLQNAILAVGMFSLFEAILQDGLNCTGGFCEATSILEGAGQAALKERFSNLQLAINVLKHGRGRSYEALVAKAGALPFRLKLPGQSFFYEGDVSEISTLIEVDDTFVSSCADVIREVSETIRRVRPEFPL
jgi:hypothetical protein